MRKTKSRVIMCYGLPGSGKTTWAKSQLNKRTKRVNRDELRMMLDNGTYSTSNENVVIEIRDVIIECVLSYGDTIIVDDTNLNPVHRKRLSATAKRFGVDFEIKDFTDVPLEECLARNSKRTDDRVPDDVIIEMHRKYLT